MRLAFLIPPMMLLAACGSNEKAAGDATEVSINAEGDGGGVKIRTGKDGGKISIGGEGAAINIDVPDFVDLDIEGDFDIDGVTLYPGSQVTKVDVNASDKAGAAIFLASKAGDYVVGDTITVDGGLVHGDLKTSIDA